MVDRSAFEGLSIGELAARSGVADATLRAWERRYGLLRPQRTPGGHRRYGHADLARVLQMVRLVGQGLPAKMAAARVAPGSTAGVADAYTRTFLSPSNVELKRHRRSLHAAAERFDGAGVHTVLADAQRRISTELLIDELVVPMLRMLGDGWRREPRHIAREHAASAAVRSWAVSRLWHRTDSAAAPVVVACPDGEYHDLGAVMASLVMAEAGWRPVMLGASTPWVSIETVIDELQPALILIGTSARAPALQLLEHWRRPQQSTVVYGGPALTQADVEGLAAVLLHTGPYAELPTRLDALFA